MSIPRRALGPTGIEVSALGFGGAPVGFLETDRAAAERLFDELHDVGVTLLDTAAGYADSEVAVGRAIARRPGAFTIVSKCGNAVDDLDGEPWTADYVTRTVERSLRRLGVETLDVMLLHSCPLEVLRRGEVVEALARAREAGKIRHAGYAGDGAAIEHAAGLADVEVLEMSASVLDQANLGAPLAAAREHGAAVITKRSIANAAWDSSLQRGFYRDYAAPYVERFATLGLTLEALREADDSITGWSDAFVRFVLSLEGVSTSVVGTTNPENLRANVASVGRGPLDHAARDMITDAFAAAAQASDEPWGALR